MESLHPEYILNKYWGYSSFRPLQRDIIESVVNGNDTLGLMPTGGGKSITFQVAGLMLEGITVIVTPLISLMKDQVDNLRRRKLRAVFFHSGMTLSESNKAWDTLTNGNARFLYISPERLKNRRFMDNLRGLKVSLIVVDEAHCISQWGYDFRPSYLNIKKLRKEFPKVAILALTATATPEVATDICDQLDMRNPIMLKMSFSRSNLNYIVRNADTKIYDTFHILSRTSGSAIVYVRSRKRTREIADYLQASGISATYYHAGLDYEIKEERQNMWKSGETRVMVATNAFGMGIDKPDVRVVIHYDFPPSLEEYYQEAGRAGRDGKKSYAVLLVGKTDKAQLRKRVTENFPEREIIIKLYERVGNFLNVAIGEGYDKMFAFDIIKFCEIFGYNQRQARACLRILSQAGYLEFIEETETRSRIMITVEREDLYSLRGFSADAEKVLNNILRNYTGLFIDYVYIYEPNIARECGTDEKRVYEALLELSRGKIISYVPRNKTPLIYYQTSREEPKYIEIGRQVYEDRKKILSDRVEAIIRYGHSATECREKMLLEYFGENSDNTCGRCDTCRDKKRNNPKQNRSDLDKTVKDIMNLLEGNAGGVPARILENKLGNSQSLNETLSFLREEGFIDSDGDMYFKK